MSDLLIRGMEMPKSCEECFAREHIEADTDHCAFDYCVFENWHQPRTPLVLTPKELRSKAPYCPLVPVPPHGRLIDADALKRLMYHEAFESDSILQKWDSGCWIRYKMFENALEDTPTIIEAEDGE